MKFYFLLFFSFFIIFSCSKDEGSNSPNPSSATIRVEGKVVNESNDPVSGAIVSSGSKTATTSSTGEFVLEGASFSERSFIKVVASGLFDAYFGFIAKVEKTAFVEVTMVSKGTPTTFNSADGKTLTNRGGSVLISPNSIVDASGNTYSGPISGYLKFLSPDQSNFGQMMQGGDFVGENAATETGVLTSYGYYSIELEDGAGKKLNIKKGSTADFTMPIAADQLSGAPSTVKLWYFDETKGIWKEEGTATKTGSNYIGKVGHFSSWNADDWNNISTIKGILKCNGVGVPNARIKLNNGNSFIYAYTNSEGNYEIRVPAGNSIQITLPGLNSENLGLLTPNQTIDKGTIESCGAAIGIITTQVTGITAGTAISGGAIPSGTDTLLSVYQRGVCWAKTPNPTISNSKTGDGSGTGSFVSTLSNLTPNTLYYVRAYASNSFGTEYGNQLTFTTLENPEIADIFNPNKTYGTMSDIDGNSYKTIQIGTQTWMAENLKTSKYGDGSIINTGINDSAWTFTTTGAYAIYDNNEANNTIYGKLYNWYAVADSRNLCPTGWHVPSEVEWATLDNFLGGASVAGGKMKSTSSLWGSPNTGATNESGFSGLPGGQRYQIYGSYLGFGNSGYWWSSTEFSTSNAWLRYLSNNNGNSNPNKFIKRNGFSVRCLKD